MHISHLWPNFTLPSSKRMFFSGQFFTHSPHWIHFSSSTRYKKELIAPPAFWMPTAAAAASYKRLLSILCTMPCSNRYIMIRRSLLS